MVDHDNVCFFSDASLFLFSFSFILSWVMRKVMEWWWNSQIWKQKHPSVIWGLCNWYFDLEESLMDKFRKPGKAITWFQYLMMIVQTLIKNYWNCFFPPVLDSFCLHIFVTCCFSLPKKLFWHLSLLNIHTCFHCFLSEQPVLWKSCIPQNSCYDHIW